MGEMPRPFQKGRIAQRAIVRFIMFDPLVGGRSTALDHAWSGDTANAGIAAVRRIAFRTSEGGGWSHSQKAGS